MVTTILVASPKGGSGKTTAARNLACAAANQGMRVAVADYDPQGSLDKWVNRRNMLAPNEVKITSIPTKAENGDDVDIVGSAEAAGFEIVFADTPPAIESHAPIMVYLLSIADMTVIPCRPTVDDIDSVRDAIPVFKKLAKSQKAMVLLNAANPRARSTNAARVQLKKFGGTVCESEWPSLEIFNDTSCMGLGLCEKRGAAGRDAILSVWNEIKNKTYMG